VAATVLDAHALLAFFRGEDAGVPVKELLHKAAPASQRSMKSHDCFTSASYETPN
jgi:hypothetical protein